MEEIDTGFLVGILGLIGVISAAIWQYRGTVGNSASAITAAALSLVKPMQERIEKLEARNAELEINLAECNDKLDGSGLAARQ